jgi:hypothetical protein
MNQPLLFHNRTSLDDAGRWLRGGLFRTYDLDAADLGSDDVSYYLVTWEKEVAANGGGWAFHHKLRTSEKYPWLMLYLRYNATRGFSGGYHYDTRHYRKRSLYRELGSVPRARSKALGTETLCREQRVQLSAQKNPRYRRTVPRGNRAASRHRQRLTAQRICAESWRSGPSAQPPPQGAT